MERVATGQLMNHLMVKVSFADTTCEERHLIHVQRVEEFIMLMHSRRMRDELRI